MMTKLAQPVTWRSVAIGVSIPVLVALISAWGKTIYTSKLDTPRFVVDSINRTHDVADLRALVLRIDSTTHRIEARIK